MLINSKKMMVAFDPEYYGLIYPEYKNRSPLPIIDYVRNGWKIGANPSPIFNTEYYLAKNPDSGQDGNNPLEHFLRTKPDTTTFPDLSKSGYMTANLRRHIEDITYYMAVKSGLINLDYYSYTYNIDINDALAHYRTVGWRIGNMPSQIIDRENIKSPSGAYLNPILSILLSNPENLLIMLGLAQGKWRREALDLGIFDPEYYEEIYPEAADPKIDRFAHYMLYGWRKDYNPSGSFNTRYYCSKKGDALDNPVCKYLEEYARGNDPVAFPLGMDFPQLDDAVQMHVGDIAAHWLKKKGWFDADWYLGNYPDVEAANVEPMEHYRRYGFRENRVPSPDFNAVWYLEEYLDGDPCMCAIWHYLTIGQREGLSPRPNDRLQIMLEENRLLFEQIHYLQDQLVKKIKVK